MIEFKKSQLAKQKNQLRFVRLKGCLLRKAGKSAEKINKLYGGVKATFAIIPLGSVSPLPLVELKLKTSFEVAYV